METHTQNNIDKLFGEESRKNEENAHFQAFEKVWKDVEQRLDNNASSKKNLPIWLPLSFAASVALIFGIIYLIQPQKSISSETITSNKNTKAIKNKRVSNIYDSVKMVKLDREIESNIQKNKNISKSNNTISKISNTVSKKRILINKIQPTEVSALDAQILESAPIIQSVNQKEEKMQNRFFETKEKDSNVVLASNFLNKDEIVAHKAKKNIPNSSVEILIPKASQMRIAENASEDKGIKEEDYNLAKISTNKGSEPLYIVDGYVADEEFIKNYNARKTTSLVIIEGKNALKLYGNYGKKGVVVITTKGLTTKEEKHLKEVSGKYKFN